MVGGLLAAGFWSFKATPGPWMRRVKRPAVDVTALARLQCPVALDRACLGSACCLGAMATLTQRGEPFSGFGERFATVADSLAMIDVVSRYRSASCLPAPFA